MTKKVLFFLFFLFLNSVYSETYRVKLKKIQASLFETEKGKKFLLKKDYGKAEKKFTLALKDFKENSMALGFLGIIYLKKREYGKASDFFSKSLQYFPTYKEKYGDFLKKQLKKIEGKIFVYEKQKEFCRIDEGGICDFMCNTAATVELAKRRKEDLATIDLKIEKLRKRKKIIESQLSILGNIKFPIAFRIGYAESLFAQKNYLAAAKQYETAALDYKNVKTFYSKAALCFVFAGNCEKAKYFLKNSPRKDLSVEKEYINHCGNKEKR